LVDIVDISCFVCKHVDWTGIEAETGCFLFKVAEKAIFCSYSAFH